MTKSFTSLHKIEQCYPKWRKAHFSGQSQKHVTHPVVKNYLFTVFIEIQHELIDLLGDSALDQTIESLHQQTYKNIEVILCCDDPTKLAQAKRLSHWKEKIQSLRGLACCPYNKNIMQHWLNTDRMVSRGDYLLSVEQGTILENIAFDLLNKAINKQAKDGLPEVLVIDHEYIDPSGEDSLRPFFFPGWDPDLMTQIPQLGKACAISRDLAFKYNDMSKSLDYPYTALTEQWVLNISKYFPWPKTAHIPSPIMRICSDQFPGYQLKTEADTKQPQGGISIVIPNKDNPCLLRNCLNFLGSHGQDDIELIIVDNGSTDSATTEYYEEIQRLYGAKIIMKPGIFNYSRLINSGAEQASREYLLLLNNDVVIPDVETLWNMIGFAGQSEVGVVGSILLYPNDLVQHAGIFLFPGPSASHVMRYAHEYDPGPGDILRTVRNYQAVTGALQVMRTALFRELQGYDEVHLPIEFNDVDFCLRVREKGLKVLCVPMNRIIHAESSTRHTIDSRESAKSRNEAKHYMSRRWKDAFENDPFANPNLSISDTQDLGLKPIAK